MFCRLIKIESNHNNVRTDSIFGEAVEIPQVGKRFSMVAPPLEAGDIRVIATTKITEVTNLGEGVLEFKTLNSTYRFENLEREKDES